MLLDYSSLLAGTGFSALCLALILFASSMATRRDGFLLTYAVAALMIVGAVITYSIYISGPDDTLIVLSFGLMLACMSTLLGAARQFRLGGPPFPIISMAAISIPVALLPIVLGFNGIGFILTNSFASLLLCFAALEFWRGRAEAPMAIAGLCVLYLVVAISFACCAGVLLAEGNWILSAAPDNWAEKFNTIAVVAAVPSVGALALALNQTRLARQHLHSAMTDPLTGLLNRRALFDAVVDTPLAGDAAVAVFDIDSFKAINDQHGHATGDRVIVEFAQAMNRHCAGSDLAARLGGEEFALVLRRTTADQMVARADAIRNDFAAQMAATHGIPCTASAGIAFVGPNGHQFEATLNAADGLLYQAKREGRDRTLIAAVRIVSDQSVKPSSSRP
ncbi:GGDEF domain-containing protein [Ancylobacter sp. A5.8]|uniref:GGDEF domain-containing protein n=1 Tax=Ancylobacter gelatini TaxID=2919920 RepID=UPI001F4DF420|nr:GGDEF domain-containing protein [Ancylobacter gelatini]MCJ8144161.1 GGDEF domain-containing protein [Ancylobacter gelatini]